MWCFINTQFKYVYSIVSHILIILEQLLECHILAEHWSNRHTRQTGLNPLVPLVLLI